VQLPYFNDALTLHVTLAGISSDDWLEHASAALLAEIHADCLASLLCTGSADVATTLLSHVGGTLVIRVVLNALRPAHRRTVEPAVLEEAISTLCLLSHRRYEGRIPELAVCFGPSRRRPDRKAPAVFFGREFLASKKSAVLLKGGTLVLHCLSNGRVVEVVDLDFASSGPMPDRTLGPLDQVSTLNYSYHRAAVTTMLTRQGEVLVAMGARICFAWDAAGWRMYPAMRLSTLLCGELTRVCTGKGKELPRHLARHITTMALTLRDDRLGAILALNTTGVIRRGDLGHVGEGPDTRKIRPGSSTISGLSVFSTNIGSSAPTRAWRPSGSRVDGATPAAMGLHSLPQRHEPDAR
jgi:hypothetical protein